MKTHPAVKTCEFRSAAGQLLWSERMVFRRLYAAGDTICRAHRWWTVVRVSVENFVQKVTVKEDA
jgi:hypothetical protein